MLSEDTLRQIASAELRDPSPAMLAFDGVHAAVPNGYDETAADRPIVLIDAETGETTRSEESDIHAAVAAWHAART